MHSVTFAEDTALFLDRYQSWSQPRQVSLCTPTERPQWVDQNQLTDEHPLVPYLSQMQTEPEFGLLTADDGTPLQYQLLKPKNFDPTKKYPVLIYVYGGPHVQLVSHSGGWGDRHFFFQFLLQQDVIVFSVDNRGSAGRGAHFEHTIYRNLCVAEVSDQIKGVEYLRSLEFVDSHNIGIYGHSYGGYMALMCLCKAPGCFKAVISGAPVSSWELYDTHYTERYQGTPQDNPDGYAAGCVLPYLPKYDDEYSRLFMYHGMADDNVLFVNSTQVYKALQDQCKLFQTMDYPGCKHSMNGEKVKKHMYKSIWDFLKQQFARPLSQ